MRRLSKQLTSLDVSHNSLTSVDLRLSSLSSLRHLDLSHNRLRTLRQGANILQQFGKKAFRAENIFISKRLFFRSIITHFRCKYCRCPRPVFSSLKQLETLDLSHNLLSEDLDR